MITAENVIDRLIESCPSFLGASDLYDFMAWSEDEGKPDAYVRVGAFAEHLFRLVERRDAGGLATIFATIDQLLDEGDHEIYDLVAMGLLEPLQNAASHADPPGVASQIRDLLGPAAGRAWDESEMLWSAAAAQVREAPRLTTTQLDDLDDANLRLYFRLGRRRMADGTVISASDVLRYEQWVADVTWRSPAAWRRNNLRALIVGVVLAFCLVLATRL